MSFNHPKRSNLNDSNEENSPNVKSEPLQQYLIVFPAEKLKIPEKFIKQEVKEEKLDASDCSDNLQLNKQENKAKKSTEIPLSKRQRSKNFKKFQCTICTVAVSSSLALKKHIKLHSRPELNCKDCGKFLRRIKNHFCNKTCKVCNRKFRHMLQFYLHLKNNHGVDVKSPIYECDICGLKTLLKSAIAAHLKSKHLSGNSPKFICDHDGREFETKTKIKYHIFMHMQKIKCKICNSEVKPAALRTHMKGVHNSDQQVKCQICSKVLKSQKYLDFHMKTHDKKFKCKICDKKFPTASKLRMHVRYTHEDIELFKCEKCLKSFKTKSDFMKHIKIHDKNRPKPFKCHKCDYSIDIKQCLDHHLKAHDRIEKRMAAYTNPVKCEKCPTLCKSEAALKAHIKAVHPAAEYECDYCGRKIKIKKGFKNHLRRFHKFDVKMDRGVYKSRKAGKK